MPRLVSLSGMALGLALGGGLVLAAPPPLGPALARRIDAVFADLDGKDSPGCALGVVREGALVYARGYGMELAFERDGRGRIRGFRLSEGRIRDIGFNRLSALAAD